MNFFMTLITSAVLLTACGSKSDDKKESSDGKKGWGNLGGGTTGGQSGSGATPGNESGGQRNLGGARKEGWTDELYNQSLQECSNEAQSSGNVSAQIAGNYCRCVLDVVVTRWSVSEIENGSDGILPALESEGILQKCKNQAGITN